MDLQNAIQEALTSAVLALLAAALGSVFAAISFGFKYVVKSMKDKAGRNEFILIQEIAHAAVKYAEQTGIKQGLIKAGLHKKNLAITFATRLLLKYNIVVEPAILDGMLEKAVHEEFQNSHFLTVAQG